MRRPLAKSESRKPIAAAHAVVESRGFRFAVVGCVDPAAVPPRVLEESGLAILDPVTAVRESLRRIEGPRDAVVLVVHGGESVAHEVRAACPEFVAAVCGRGSSASVAPALGGGCVIARPRGGGKTILRLELAVRGASCAAFRADEIALPASGGESADAARLLAGYKSSLRNLNARPVDPGAPRYAGAQACASCHRGAFDTWERSRHRAALGSLEAHGDQFDPDCLRCHTVSFDQSNGFRVGDASGRFAGVQCESCHGPGAAHAADPSVHTPAAARQSCLGCHDGENSPSFAFEEYWPRVAHR